MEKPRNNLTCHLMARIRKIPCKTEIGDLELAVGSNQQVVWLQVLGDKVKSGLLSDYLNEKTYSMQDPISVAELQTTQSHR